MPKNLCPLAFIMKKFFKQVTVVFMFIVYGTEMDKT